MGFLSSITGGLLGGASKAAGDMLNIGSFGLLGGGGGGGSSPTFRNSKVAKQYSDLMRAALLSQYGIQTGTGQFSDIGPLLNLEQNPQYGVPAWTNLNLSQLNQVLNGTPGGQPYSYSNNVPIQQAGWYNQDTGQLVAGGKGRSPGGNVKWMTPGQQLSITQSGTTQSAPGLMALQAGANTAARTADIADVANLGPAAHNAVAWYDPTSTNILDTMSGQANYELGLGGNLTPAMTRTVTQGVLANNQGMLGGTGNAGDYALALGLSSYGQQLQNMRRQYAGNVLTARNQYYGDPYQRVLGWSTPGTASVNSAQGISAGVQNPFNPESSMAANIFGSNQQIGSAKYAADKNMQTSLWGAGIGALGSLGGGALSLI